MYDNSVKTDVVLLFEHWTFWRWSLYNLSRFFRDALNVSEITEDQLGETIKSIPEPLKEKIMTTYTMLIEKGKLEEKNEVIVSLFDEGFETAKIAKIVKLSEEKVVAILKDKEKLK